LDRELLLLTLKFTKEAPFVDVNELIQTTSNSRVKNFFKEIEGFGIILQPTIDGGYTITSEQRARLVILGALNGFDFEKIIKELTWQEFELLTTFVGDEFGYAASTGLNFSTEERKYQIDVILRNKPYVLLIDCKHFGGTGKQSVLRNAATEQIQRVEAVVAHLEKLQSKLRIRNWKKIVFIPLVITWLDDEVFFYEQVPVVPFSKLRSFFQNFYLYIEDIFQIVINI